MPNDYVIHAVKAVQPFEESAPYWIPQLYDELKKGRARFGWCWLDLKSLREKIEHSGWEKLGEKERNLWGHASFFLDVSEGDYLIYINMPEYSKCTLVRVVAGGYSYSRVWDSNEQKDFRHVLPCQFVATFDRNDPIVAPYLSVRLKLQGAHWRIYAEDEFTELLTALTSNKKGRTAEERLHSGITDALASAAESIRRNFPRKELERLVEALYRNVPNVKSVRKGPDWDGADVVIEFEGGIPGLPRTEVCAVQVKAYEGALGYERAVQDIEKAFVTNPQYTCGLIVSTALEMTSEFEDKLEKLRDKHGKPVGTLLGRDLALNLIKHHGVGAEGRQAATA
jgi:hypothetical protein